MERIKVNDTRMESLVVLYDMHTEYFKRAIVEITAADAHDRLNTKANHVAWLAGSLVQQRFEFATIFGSDLKSNADDLFKDYQGIQDDVKYPALDEFLKDWEKITPVLRNILLELPPEKLDSILEFPDMPEMNMPHFDFIAFMIYREANCIGQIALWRRLLGYPALKYD